MEAANRNLFPKKARLSLKRDIDHLFENGQSFLSYPLRIIYLSDSVATLTESGISILISVPKKRIKRAVQRNRIKRLTREAFRLNQHIIPPTDNRRLHIAFLYIANEVLPYTHIEKAMRKTLRTIHEKTEPTNTTAGSTAGDSTTGTS